MGSGDGVKGVFVVCSGCLLGVQLLFDLPIGPIAPGFHNPGVFHFEVLQSLKPNVPAGFPVKTVVKDTGCYHAALRKNINHFRIQLNVLFRYDFQDAHGVGIAPCPGRAVVNVILGHTVHDERIISVGVALLKKAAHDFLGCHNRFLLFRKLCFNRQKLPLFALIVIVGTEYFKG